MISRRTLILTALSAAAAMAVPLKWSKAAPVVKPAKCKNLPDHQIVEFSFVSSAPVLGTIRHFAHDGTNWIPIGETTYPYPLVRRGEA